jgi:PAS domain-containing protein
LILTYEATAQPRNETLLICREVARSFLAGGAFAAPPWDGAKTAWRRSRWWPRGAAWKAHLLGWLQQRIMTRSLFVERALHSIEDGLLIAAADGCITFANPRAARILGISEPGLVGSDLFARLRECEQNHRGAVPVSTPEERRV